MNLFEIFSSLNHKSRISSWIETTATFTGDRNRAAARTKTGFREKEYFEYAITYDVSGKTQTGYYSFYPLPDPEIDEIKGKTIKIKYNKRKPYLFELIADEYE